MKLLIDIQDNKAAAFIEIIKSYSYVKAKPLSAPDAELLEEIREIKKAFKYAGRIKTGKLKGRYKVLTIAPFDKQLKHLVRKYPSLKSEFAELVKALKTDPEKGTSIGHECYKIRLAIASKGKGSRVAHGLLPL